MDFWRSPLLTALPGIAHGFTRRGGGVSAAPYDSLNLGLHVGDDADAVCENRRRAAGALGFSWECMVCAEQIHGGKVAVVTEADAGRGAFAFADALPSADALITNTPNLLLTLFFADCLPVFFVSPEKRVIGLAHAGWRGLVAGVLENTVAALHIHFGASPDTLRVALGPGIGPDAFTVGAEVAARFPHAARRHPETNQWTVNLPADAARRLRAAGIPAHQISPASECPHAHPALYFSHRRDHGKTGRMAAFLALQNKPRDSIEV